ncbi:MAG: phage Gp37/Gp68 family protein [Veillonellales bacterium]
MGKSKIEWCDRTWSPVTGCTKVSPGCQNCYAERMSKRFGEKWGLPKDDPFKVTVHHDRLDQPLHWTKPSKIFVCSMADLFHDDVSFNFIHEIWDIMKACPQHTFLILTKRPKKMKETLERIYSLERLGWAKGFWNHVWLGVTAENQEQADKRIPILLQIPAAKRFVSVEPMLGTVNLNRYIMPSQKAKGTLFNAPIELSGKDLADLVGFHSLDWIICGGESGPGARPVHPDWVRSLRDQCKMSGTAFLFKQWGEWAQVGECGNESDDAEFYNKHNTQRINHNGGMGYHGAGSIYVQHIGKKKAGRLLDGQLWDEYPGCESNNDL